MARLAATFSLLILVFSTFLAPVLSAAAETEATVQTASFSVASEGNNSVGTASAAESPSHHCQDCDSQGCDCGDCVSCHVSPASALMAKPVLSVRLITTGKAPIIDFIEYREPFGTPAVEPPISRI